MPHKFFSSTYSQARDRFREAAINAGATVDELELGASGPNNEKLTINIAWLGAKEPERVLLHTSGLHGVEGFVGSAIQVQLLNNPPQLRDTDTVVLVHGINAYGMAWLRRVNESNVDLNRNCLGPTEQYEGAPDGYHKLNTLLNPQSSPKLFDIFYAGVAWYILRYGFSNLRQAVAGGQYHYPHGLFFGGDKLEQSPALLLEWLKQKLVGVRHIGAIDVHTGLGKYGVDSLDVSYDPKSEPFKQLKDRLGERITTHDPHGVFYRVRGSFLEALGREMPQVDWACVLQEFGTFHVLRVLKALREENRWHHYGQKDQLDHSAKQGLLQAFCPDDDRWRREILSRGRELVDDISPTVFVE
ncbi:M14 family metallopeptidase [Acidobacteria bacterium AH-259-A15]|nr:M14 family metallopeptidase [Acidobacteria bacterium AH-259-A15]